MDFTLHVWRQASPTAPGALEVYPARGISDDASATVVDDAEAPVLDRSAPAPVPVQAA